MMMMMNMMMMSVCVDEYRRLCGPQTTHDVCSTFSGLCENGECIPMADGSFNCQCLPGYKSTSQPNHCAGHLLANCVLSMCCELLTS